MFGLFGFLSMFQNVSKPSRKLNYVSVFKQLHLSNSLYLKKHQYDDIFAYTLFPYNTFGVAKCRGLELEEAILETIVCHTVDVVFRYVGKVMHG